ncbi:sterol desaturase family protein [Neotabrizicola shimadae]|uniref:Sterol desaturase family protein n=1 Tax=Neotabrizicola shimadae TaxID=2807096 RepID=A0A8G0ZXP8_9RHOB|nr:sterol desaturase family protein [Neotabrizicola shimadae]QYZ72107.1 sterol desaturase family protein [Neotabrizicola shimadae]
MDDLKFGTRDKRGNWTPNEPAGTAPVFVWPPRPLAVLKWLPGYFFPYNILFFLSALAWWNWVIPPVEVMQTLAWGWVLKLFAVNAVAVFLWYFAFELQLYIRRAQGNRFKYNGKFPADAPSDVFWFRSQNLDNVLRGFLSGVPLWTAVQVIVLWAFANGYAPWLSFADHPVYLALLCLVVPVIHEFHFFCIHRLIHTPLLYKWVHSVHHNSINPSPWSSLSMHPVEHLLYFSTIFYHLIIPSNPIIAIYQLHVAGFGAVPGHVGFDKIEVTDETTVDSHAYIHYLHHKYFEVNYGDGLIPIDKWLGTFHDGSKDSDEQMKARFQAKKARANAKKSVGTPAE